MLYQDKNMKKDNIILIGMPGSGKSTAGVLFAKNMNYRFLDVDFLIQEHEGKRLYEVIEEKGNDYFLSVEDKINASLEVERTVVATGGLSKEIITHCNHNIIYNENLLLEGLRVIYEKNN